MEPFTLLIKPSGSDCNLDCSYCFYKNRAPQIGQGKQRMSLELANRLIKDYLKLGFPMASFAWQGGEPTLMGLDFYKHVVDLQKKHRQPNQQITNALQTNGVLLDEQWCEFLSKNKFLVGISLDGPKKFHDYYRLDHAGKGSFDRVTKAVNCCKAHNVEFNILVLLNDQNVTHPDELFDFFIKSEIKYLQFITCVEKDTSTDKIADFSITAQQYGDFLCRTFDRWREYGPDKLSIRDFDSILSYCLNRRHTICTFEKLCSQYIVVEHNGDCFVCDFFVEPKWRLGNILDTPIDQLASSEKKRTFSRQKQQLCNKCLVCRHLDICRGGCPKDRLILSGDTAAENYFCDAYKQFFEYATPKFMQIAAAIAVDSTNKP